MSRIGRKPITIPSGVEVKLDGSHILVKGPKGTLERDLNGAMQVAMEGSEIVVTRPSENKEHKSLHGLTRTLISNMVEGVTTGFKKELEINGVGYRAAKQGKDLVMNLGYSHQVIVSEIPGITIEVPAPNKSPYSALTNRLLASLPPRSARNAHQNLIKARASNTWTK